MDLEKIKSIKDWPTPTSVTDIRSFLGLAGYYRKSIGRLLENRLPHDGFAEERKQVLMD